MVFLLFAFLSAFFESLKDLFAKLGVSSLNEYVITWSLMAFAVPFLLPLLFFIDIPDLNSSFYWSLLIGGSVNALAFVLYIRAISRSDLSVTIPMITFTPLFLLLTSPIMIGEYPSLMGLGGVLLIVSGSYLLNIKKRELGILAPFKALIHEPGPRLMLLVAFLWSFTSNIDKIGIEHSSPLFWPIALVSYIAIVLFPCMFIFSARADIRIRKHLKFLIPLGLFNALALTFQMIAINLALVAYVISIKRGSTILSVLWGHFILKEEGIKERLTGVVIMVLGVILIALS